MTQAQNLHQSMTETAAYDGQPAQLVTLSNVHGMEVRSEEHTSELQSR